jgi:hypothetical protein
MRSAAGQATRVEGFMTGFLARGPAAGAAGDRVISPARGARSRGLLPGGGRPGAEREAEAARFRGVPIPAREEEMQMDHSRHQRLETAALTEANLVDAPIYGPGDEKIGTVAHLHGTGAGAEVIVDVGGFLGIGARPVALAVSQLDFMRDEDGEVHATTTMTKEQLKALPEHHH